MITRDADKRVDAEIDEIAQRILLELESASSKDLSDAHYAKMMLRLSDVHYTKRILQQIGNATSGAESEIGKRAVIKVLLFSTWLQRLYFIIRSFIMGLLSASITFLFILYFGSIDLRLQVVLGMFTFVFSLAVSRLFDVQIVKATKKIVAFLGYHKSLRNFILNHF